MATYEWRALASRVGWTRELAAPAQSGPAVRPLVLPGGRTAPPRQLPGAAAACPRDVLGRLLASATERADVVAALAIEKETLALCAERQALIVDIVKLDKAFSDAVASGTGKKAKPRRGSVIKSVAQLASLSTQQSKPASASAERPPGPKASNVEAASLSVAAARPVPAVDRGAPATSKARYSWFSLLGTRGRLLAGVTDGRRSWFVTEGDELPDGGLVRKISGRPPGVEVAGLGLLPWTGKPTGGGEQVSERAPEPAVPAETQAADRSRAAMAGRARVIDGDTLDVGGVRLRLWGIDAPEKRQTCRTGGRTWNCGGLAIAALRSRSGDVRCESKGRDRYGRVLGVCFEVEEDVNAWLVSEGWALAYRRYSTDYVEEEKEARKEKRGVHRGEFVAPWDWRRGKRLPALMAEPATEGSNPVRSGSVPSSAMEEKDAGLPPLPGSEDVR